MDACRFDETAAVSNETEMSVCVKSGGEESSSATPILSPTSPLPPPLLTSQDPPIPTHSHHRTHKLLSWKETGDNNSFSCSDIESDSGFESGPHGPKKAKAVGGATIATVANSDGHVIGDQLDDERLERLIECLDEKVDLNTLTDEAIQLLRLVPDGYILLPHQVGGHRHVEGKLGFLRRIGEPDILFKPLQVGSKGPREVHFYNMLFGKKPEDLPRDLRELREMVPGYHGTEMIADRTGCYSQFLKLEDVTSRFSKPSIMDIKVGRRVWDDFAERDKIEREKKKYPPQEIIGFRIIGMRVYQNEDGTYKYFNKEFGRSVSVSGLLEALKHFFLDGDQKRCDVIGPIVERLRHFQSWFHSQSLFRLFATSLLIIYEGDTSKPIEKPQDLFEIRLVDFAHAYKRNRIDRVGPDENTLYGLVNLVKFLEKLK